MAKSKGKENVFKKLINFFSGVKEEGKKVIWTSKKNLVKYSLATLGFMVFICLFFIATDTIKTLFRLLFTYVKEFIG